MFTMKVSPFLSEFDEVTVSVSPASNLLLIPSPERLPEASGALPFLYWRYRTFLATESDWVPVFTPIISATIPVVPPVTISPV